MRNNTPWPAESVAVLAHGAGSTVEFLRRAFPAERLGVARCYFIEDRSGDVVQIQRSLRAVTEQVSTPVIVGGVSLGAHAAGALLASPNRPEQAIAGLICLPAWLGPPDDVAGMTRAAADDISRRGSQEVLADLDAQDWVVSELAKAWRYLNDDHLAAELAMTSNQPAPTAAALSQLQLPIGVVALADDPLHPEIVARRWAAALPQSGLSVINRHAPSTDRSMFAEHGRRALTQCPWSAPEI